MVKFFKRLIKVYKKKEVGISKENLSFLRELKQELLTQSNDGNADPIFWGVAENIIEYGIDTNYSDGAYLYSSKYEFCIMDTDDIENAKQDLLDNEILTEEQLEGVNSFNDLADLTNEGDLSDFELFGYRILRDQITDQTGCFITKRACKNHIKLNCYHYKEPHTYAMTAWRNPEYERLLKIIKETDW